MAGAGSAEPEQSLTTLGVVRDQGPHLSVSQLNSYHDCSLKYQLKYVDRVPKEASGAMIAGIAVHRAIEACELEGWWPDAELFQGPAAPGPATFLQVFHTLIRDARGPIRWGGNPSGSENADWWDFNGVIQMQRYQHARVAMAGNGWGVAEDRTEYRVEVQFDGVSRPVVGYLDKFLVHEGGEPIIVDWKTGKVGYADPMQFATYARALEIVRGIHVTRGMAIFLRAAKAASAVRHMVFTDLIPRVDGIYAAMERSMDAGVYTPNTKAWCDTCEVRESCWYFKGSREA